jgi:outer membrane receptor protein involved in Fe transport
MKHHRSPQRSLHWHRLALALATCLAMAPSAFAQTTSATLRGQAAADAEITATNPATGLVRKVKASADGSYSLGGLPPGTYEVSTSGTSGAQAVTLQVGQTATLNLTAPPATPTPSTLEQVEVHATTLAETRTSEIATYITSKQIEALPQGSRNFLAFADTVPGMQFSQSSDGSTKLKSGAQSANGINVYIDGVGQKNYVLKGGVSNQDSSRGNPFPQLAIGEYKVITSNYKAEYDQISSAAITAVTKSGTNEFHGDIFFDYTDQDWRHPTPNELQTDNKVQSMEKQYGVAIGGPIVKDILQFFFTYEAKDYAEPAEVRIGQNVTLNQLPENLRSQVGTSSVPFNEDLYFTKLTWNVNEENLVELTAKYRSEDQLSNIGNGQNVPFFGSTKQQEDKRGDLRWQYSIDHWLNDAHLTFEDSFFSPHALNDGVGYRLTTPNRDAILNAGAGEENQFKGQKGTSIQDDLSYTDFEWNGEHTFKMGFKYKSVKLKALEQAPNSPQFFYDILASTTIPYRVEFGQLVPGVDPGPVESTNKQYGVYFQDDWAVNEHLTLNLGLRYDYEKTPSYLDYVTRPDLVAALHSWTNIQHTDYNIDNYISNGHNRKAFKDAWQPRLGFSYDLFGDQEHVIFGGLGRAYDRTLFDYLQLEQTKGVFPRYGFDFDIAGHGCQAGATCIPWDPKYMNPTELAKLVAANPNLGGEINLMNNNLKTPYSDQFSLGMRNTLGDWNTSVTLQHVESHDGIIFSYGNRWPDGSYRDPSKPNATWGNGPGGFPIPGFGTLIKADNGVETRLNALLLSLEKPYTKESRWGATVAYTFNDAKENRVNAADADEHYTFDYPNLSEHGWHRSIGIPRHRVVLTGIVDAGWGTTVSGKLTVSSPLTKDALNCHDTVSFDNCFFDPFTPTDRIGFKQFDIAAAKTWDLDGQVQLHLRADLLNVFNWTNWTDYDTWRGGPSPDSNANFGNVNGTGIILPTRTLKLSIGASF